MSDDWAGHERCAGIWRMGELKTLANYISHTKTFVGPRNLVSIVEHADVLEQES